MPLFWGKRGRLSRENSVFSYAIWKLSERGSWQAGEVKLQYKNFKMKYQK